MKHHTPAPWPLNSEGAHTRSIVVGVGTPQVRVVAKVYTRDDEGEANALLISAAPDLIEVVRGLFEAGLLADWELGTERQKAAMKRARIILQSWLTSAK